MKSSLSCRCRESREQKKTEVGKKTARPIANATKKKKRYTVSMGTKEPAIDHTDILRKMIYRLEGDLTTETRARLETVIKVYARLYVKA